MGERKIRETGVEERERERERDIHREGEGETVVREDKKGRHEWESSRRWRRQGWERER